MGERVGKYEVLAPLTEGGMAQLLLGATAGPGGFRKYVVIKRILPEGEGDENLVKMFLDEARITAAFSHPNIGQVYDLGEDPQGLYVVMELIGGQNLNEVISACAEQEAVLPLGFSVAVIHDCALALQYAHTFQSVTGEKLPVIHRDVALKNIMVTYDGQVKLLDFGIAKVKNALAKTRAGTIKGTAGYMSPEQVRGEVLDARSDVFSLGVVLWEMLCGRRLFSAQSELDELKLILEVPIPAAIDIEASVPLALSQAVERALKRDRSLRFGSAREFARALQSRASDLFFDVEERARFMKERFSGQIRATQRLLEVANRSSEEVNDAVRDYQRHGPSASPTTDPEGLPPRARTQLSSSKLVGVRGKPKARAPSKPRDAGTRIVARAAVSKDARTTTEVIPASGGSRVGRLLGLVALLGAGAVVAYSLLGASLESGEPVPAARSSSLAPPEAIDVIPGMSEPKEREAVVSRTPTPAPRAPRPEGEVVLVLFPEARVSLGPQLLGEGSMVNFSLPAGTHLVTVQGHDGVRRKLSLRVAGGKNKPQRFKLEDLPVE
jgi:serine/threonine-protein kinase